MATVVRAQYAREVCHTCFKDMLTQPAPQGPRPYKRYCSLACAQADTHAGLTQALHTLVQELSGKVQVPALYCSPAKASCINYLIPPVH